LAIAILDKPLQRRDFSAALWAGLIVYTLLIAGRRTFLTINAMAAIWPAAGVLAVTLLLSPRRTWKWILLIAAGETVAINLAFGFSTRTLLSLPESILLAVLIRRVCPPSLNFADPKTLLRFILLAAAPACLASSAACYFMPNLGAPHTTPGAAVGWFTGHMLGAAIAVPTMATLLRPRRYRVFDRSVWEMAAACLAVLVYATMLFHGHSPVLSLMMFPMAMFVAFRYGPIGASAMSVMLMGLALLHIYAGIPGPRPDTYEKVQWVQMFVAVVFITSLPAAGALASLSRTRRLLATRTNLARAARRRADEAALAKSRFLANMSHEIRTPLNGVIGLADALSRTVLLPPQREMVEMVQGSGRALNGILCDVLDLARADAGGLRLTREPFDVGEAVSAASYLFETIAQKKDVAFEVAFELECRSAVVGDALRIRQILSNLISNAVKFTHQGKVLITARLKPHASEPGLAHLSVEVADTGPGFDDEVRSRLFRRFEQADNSVARRYGGTGLGLAISRELAQMMDGRIDCESEPGKGSVFTLRLTLPIAAEEPAAPEPMAELAVDSEPEGGRRQTVLLAEDHPVNQRVVQAILGDRVNLTIVEDGKAAVQAFATHAFDLILMDTQMPVMDGLTAIRTIRAMEAQRGGRRIPIVSLTADALPNDVQEALAAGADRHLAKPVSAAALLGTLSEVLEQKAA
jgi:signal transduction histidine kinase/ActR/RegA family two-component response regulator